MNQLQCIISVLVILLSTCMEKNLPAQPVWTVEHKVVSTHLRGLCVVNDSVVWASGAGGSWLKTINGGKSWTTDTIPGASKLDFRDIHAIDTATAWVISAGDIAKIYHTDDGGKNWEEQYTNTSEGVFFDGLAFWDEQSGIAYSDPIEGKLLIITTDNGGKTWKEINTANLPTVLAGEAGFAASGTGIVINGDSTVWIATGGGEKARVFRSKDRGVHWEVFDTPIVSGEGAGIFSMAFMNENDGVIVGGDYVDSVNATANCAITSDGGQTWQLIKSNQPNGYRSCVAAIGDSLLITVGRTGSEYSTDKGLSWKPLGKEGYYSCGCSESYCWAVGRGGKMARLKF